MSRIVPALGALALLSLVLAGCTTPTPPPGGPTGVRLDNPPATALPGATLTIAWRVVGSGEGVTHSELHYGPDPQPAGLPYASTALGNGGPDRWTATIAAPASGTLYLRAHLQAGGRDLWSDEGVIRVQLPAPEFRDVNVPATAEAGVPFPIRYTLGGSGTSNHVGAHFSNLSSAGFAANFAPTSWPGVRASEHVTTGFTLPGPVDVAATLPFPGTWYLRPHLLMEGTNHWGAEVTITATNPARPNIVLLNRNTTATAGQAMLITYALNAPNGTSGHVGAHFSMNSSAALPAGFPPANWSGQRASPHHGTITPVNIPAIFDVNITFPLPGTWYYRPHALVGSEQVWGEEVRVEVAHPAKAVYLVSAPTNHTILLTNVQPASVEWAVVPGMNQTTNHTHIHHGPASVASPAEDATGATGYPQRTAVQSGEVPGLFRANVTVVAPSTSGPYYLRAMAIVTNDQGQQVEVWSDEWVVQVEVRPT